MAVAKRYAILERGEKEDPLSVDLGQNSNESMPPMGGQREADLLECVDGTIGRFAQEHAQGSRVCRLRAHVSCGGIETEGRRILQRDVDDPTQDFSWARLRDSHIRGGTF